MPGYEPIEPVDVVARRLGIAEDRVVKLDGNENPYGPSPRVAEALSRFPYYHIYPDPEQRRIREAVAGYVGVDPEQIVLGSGSDELLDLVARLLLSPGDVVLNAPPTFGMYEFLSRVHSARLVEAPRREDFGLDLPAMEVALSDGAKLVFLASPNNPTGNALPGEHLERLLRQRAMVLVDEAYAEFAGESFVHMVKGRNNLGVVRTFSKWAGLAGLRVGYGVFPEPLAQAMRKIKMPYNLNVAAEVAVLASLEDPATLREHVEAIVSERERLRQRLAGFSWLRPYPSQANFLLCEVRGRLAREVRDRLRQQGILVRYFDAPGVRNCLRISVGRPEHTGRLLEALEEIGAGVGK
ncbi:MAG: histidinol-phosphate transaminase [Chloroflexi bacterium]|nr:histidinol-phosphate transaminase [Chloroflexota bacterium]